MRLKPVRKVLNCRELANFYHLVKTGIVPRAWYHREQNLHKSRWYVKPGMEGALKAFMARHSQGGKG